MLLQWVLLQHTEKGTKKAHISHEVQDFTVVICLEKKRGLAGSMPWTGVWCSVPTHRHRYLTWTELCTSSTATANTLATHPDMPLKQCRLGLGLDELLQQERILLPPSAFCSTHWAHLTIHYQDPNFSSTAQQYPGYEQPLPWCPSEFRSHPLEHRFPSSRLVAQRVQAF